VSDRTRGDQGIAGACRRLATGGAQRCGDPTEGSGAVGVERKNFKVGLGLL
jgi:hypothetical protein